MDKNLLLFVSGFAITSVILLLYRYSMSRQTKKKHETEEDPQNNSTQTQTTPADETLRRRKNTTTGNLEDSTAAPTTQTQTKEDQRAKVNNDTKSVPKMVNCLNVSTDCWHMTNKKETHSLFGL